MIWSCMPPPAAGAGAAGAAAGGGAACAAASPSWYAASYCACCSPWASAAWLAYFWSWRCRTAPAVPATTAVVAAARTRPGPLRANMLRSPFLGVCLLDDPLAGRLDDLVRDTLEGDELAAGVAHGLGHLPRPDVLPHEHRGGG